MDKEQDIVLAQDSLIELPESLLTAFTTSGGVLRCNNMQTTCPGCMGASGQCSTGECATCETSQCICETFQCRPNNQCGPQCGSSLCGSAQCGNYECSICQDCQRCQSDQGCSSCESGQNPTSSGSITSYSTTSDSITIHYTSISKATSYEIVYRVDGESTLYTAGTTSALSFTITGLSPQTKYVVNYRGKNSYGYGAFMATGKTITTDRAFEPFDWTYAGRDPSTNARIAGSTKQSGLVACITADEWNRLVDSVNQWKGTSISRVSSGAMANSTAVVRPVANALGVSIPSGFSAAFFNSLRSAYNNLG